MNNQFLPKIRQSNSRNLPFGVVVVLLLAAFFMRVFLLDAQSLWWDEGISLHLATVSWGEIVANRAANIHPPLYFFLLKLWVGLAGISPFSARYLSVLASFLQVPLIFKLVKHWWGQGAALLAVWLMVFFPPSVIYGQETRVYAILPLVYLVLLFYADIGRSQSISRRYWLGLGVAEWIGLHLHYLTLFLVLYVGGWIFVYLYRRRDWAGMRQWVWVQTGVGLASLPWALTVVYHWVFAEEAVNVGRFLAEPVAFSFLLSQVWLFHLTGLAGTLGRPFGRMLAVLVLGVVSLLLVERLARRVTRGKTLSMAAHWLIPLSSALVVWAIRPFSHPRYISIFVPGFILLLIWLVWPHSKNTYTFKWSPRLLAVVPVLVIFVWADMLYFFDPSVAKDDLRGVAGYLESVTGPDDLIFVPDTNWVLDFEYHGQGQLVMPFLNKAGLWERMANVTADSDRAYALRYETTLFDWQNQVPFMLEQAGSLVRVQEFEDLAVAEYALHRPIEKPVMSPVFGRFGGVELHGVWLEQDAPADTAVTLALQWQLVAPVSDNLNISVRLLDIDGWPLATKDDMLLDYEGRPTAYWATGQTVTTYHILPLLPGTPPLSYQLAITVYVPDGESIRVIDGIDLAGQVVGPQMVLGNVVLKRPFGITSSPYPITDPFPPLPVPVPVADGLLLLAAAPNRQTVGEGDTLFVGLRWQATRSNLPNLQPALGLKTDRGIIAVADGMPALGRYPTNFWQVDEIVVEHRSLVIPPQAEGTAELVVMLADTIIPLGKTVEITAESRTFSPPVILNPLNVQFGDVMRLIGYELPGTTIKAGEPVEVTLYWEALTTGTAVDYTVFTHLLAEDGRLIGQHDSPPLNGTRPTRSLVAGEYLTDPHLVTFKESNYTGIARIGVGLYDPTSGERLLTEDGLDVFLLPIQLTVQP